VDAAIAFVDGDGFIDGDRTRSAAFNFERLWGQILGRAKSCGERDGRSAIGEFEIDFNGERVTVMTDLISLFSDGLFKFVKRELALLDDGWIGGSGLLRGRERGQCEKKDCKNPGRKRMSGAMHGRQGYF
jgi:hypothetical protein